MLRDPYQTQAWAKLKREWGYAPVEIGETLYYVKPTILGNVVDVQYPNNSPKQVQREVARMKPIILTLFNDPQYSGDTFESPITTQSAKIDLTQPTETLWKNTSHGFRNHFHQSEKMGCNFVENQNFESFYPLYKKLSELKGFSTLKKEVMRRVSKSPMGHIFFTTYANEFVSTAFLLCSESVARYWYGATLPEHYMYRPSHMLQWGIIQWAKREGYEQYDLGGASTNNVFKNSCGSKLYPQQKISLLTLRGKLAKTLNPLRR